MNNRRIIVLLVLVTTLLLSLAPSLIAAAEPSRWEYKNDYDDEIEIEVYAPYEAYPGDEITITVRVEAKEDLDDVTIDLLVVGSKDMGHKRWDDEISVLDDETLDDGDEEEVDEDLKLPSTLDPGQVYGHIFAEWENEDGEQRYENIYTFILTYIKHKDYEDLLVEHAELEADYAELSDLKEELEADVTEWESKYKTLEDDYESLELSHETLQTDYADLESKYETAISERDAAISERDAAISERNAARLERDATAEELSDYQTYVYILVGTTILFIATTIIFAVRKPKTI